MRVSKIIREYVEKTITEKMPFGAPSKEFKAARENLLKVEDEINIKVKAYAAKLCAEANKDLPEGFNVIVCGNSPCDSRYWNAPLHIASNTHENEVRKRRTDAIESILVELELGATKADLERLIAEAIS